MKVFIFPACVLLILFTVMSCSNNGKSLESQNKLIIERYFNEVWNNGNLEILNELLSEDYINHTPSTPDPPPGPEGLKPIVKAIRRGFPDLHYEIKDIIITDERVVSRVLMTGTQTDSLFNIPPSGKRVEVNQINIEKIKNGKIVEH